MPASPCRPTNASSAARGRGGRRGLRASRNSRSCSPEDGVVRLQVGVGDVRGVVGDGGRPGAGLSRVFNGPGSQQESTKTKQAIAPAPALPRLPGLHGRRGRRAGSCRESAAPGMVLRGRRRGRKDPVSTEEMFRRERGPFQRPPAYQQANVPDLVGGPRHPVGDEEGRRTDGGCAIAGAMLIAPRSSDCHRLRFTHRSCDDAHIRCPLVRWRSQHDREW